MNWRSFILRHPIGPCHCSVPPLRPVQSRQSAAVAYRGKAVLTGDLLSSLPDRAALPNPILPAAQTVRFVIGTAAEEGFCATVWSSKGRSQLLIQRCKEKAPERKVRYRLRNRNYCVFSVAPSRAFRRAFMRRFSLFVIVRDCEPATRFGPGDGDECEYVA